MDIKISALPLASSIAGTEYVPIVQGGVTKKVLASALIAGAGSVDSVNGYTGVVILSKTDIGLGSVNNTSDVSKPVSTAQATADGVVLASANSYTDSAILNKQDKVFKITSATSATAQPDTHYLVQANSTFNDIASPVAGSNYRVKVAGGGVTINATATTYTTEGTIVERYYTGSVWTTNVYRQDKIGTIVPVNTPVTSDISVNELGNRAQGQFNQLNKKYTLKSFQRKAYDIVYSALPKVNIRVATIGDSVSLDTLFPLQPRWQQGYGYGGTHGGNAFGGINSSIGGGATSAGAPILLTSLTRVGTTATATSPNHGLSNGNTVTITGANDTLYNLTASISNVTTNTFDYTVSVSAITPDTSTTIYFRSSSDYNKSIIGGWINLNGAGNYLQQNRPTYASLPSAIINTVKVFYVKEVGGGSFKLQTSPDNVTWADISGSTTSCSDSQDNFGVGTYNLSEFSGQMYLRAIWVSGACKLHSLGFETNKGLLWSFLFSAGGLQLKDMLTTPARIWKDYLKELDPDLLAIEFKDDTDAGLIAAVSTLQSYIDAVAPRCTTVWTSCTLAPQDAGFIITPYNQTSAAQNEVMKSFVESYAGTGEVIYYDNTKYIGAWSQASKLGYYDEGTVLTLTTATISGTTATVTTSAPHGYSGTKSMRISYIADNLYNGVFRCTFPTSTTISYTLTGTLPSGSSTGGETVPLSNYHLTAAGRSIRAAAFERDFEISTGLNMLNYPGIIGTDLLTVSNVALLTTNSFTGKQSVLNTTDASGTTFGSDGDAALKVAGGIFAAKIIRTEKQLLFQGSNNGIAGISSIMTSSSGNGSAYNGTLFFTPSVNTGPTSVNTAYFQLTLSPSGTANINSFTNNGVYGFSVIQGSGTGTITATGGVSGQVNHVGSQIVTFGTGVGSVVIGSGRYTNALGFTAYVFPSGIVTTSIAYNIDPVCGTNSATNKWGFYNQSVANSASLGMYKFGAITAPTALVDIAAGTATVAPLKMTSGTSLTTPVNGTLEFDGTRYYITTAGVRKSVRLNSYKPITATYTITNDDCTLDATSGTFTVTLPTAIGIKDTVFIIKNSGVGTITIDTTSSQTIDGTTTKVLSVQYSGVVVQSTGTNWSIIGTI